MLCFPPENVKICLTPYPVYPQEEWSDLDDDEDINISPPPVHVVRFSRPSLLLPGESGQSPESASAGPHCCCQVSPGGVQSLLQSALTAAAG